MPNKSSTHFPTLHVIILVAPRFLNFIFFIRTTEIALNSSFPQVSYVTFNQFWFDFVTLKLLDE